MPKKGTPLQELLREYKWRRRLSYPQLAVKSESKVASVYHMFHGRRGIDVLGIKAPPGRRPLLFRLADAMQIPKAQLRKALADTVVLRLDKEIQKYLYRED